MNLSSDVQRLWLGIPEKLPCNPGGGSPSLYHEILCITGPLFTKRSSRPYRHFGLASKKSNNDRGNTPHRVEQPNHKLSTKVGILSASTSQRSSASLLKFIVYRLVITSTNIINTSIINISTITFFVIPFSFFPYPIKPRVIS
ncbi:hypothetical protein MNBD_GAMMA12-758 [hydrothermal vent metagenome]|uniref:Uncharacterized protein n=1 Tax=hydrothermal vent metagenome TaxID=652676 RepID=A0A3B0Y627_9ZZZZ